MKTDRLWLLLADCVGKIHEFEEDIADGVLLRMGFTYEELVELGYRPELYSIDELEGWKLDEALDSTREAEFDNDKEVSREDLIEYNRMTEALYTYDGYFVGYGSTLDQNTPIPREDD